MVRVCEDCVRRREASMKQQQSPINRLSEAIMIPVPSPPEEDEPDSDDIKVGI